MTILPALVSKIEIHQHTLFGEPTISHGYMISVILPNKSLSKLNQARFDKVINCSVYGKNCIEVGDALHPTRYKCVTQNDVSAIINVIQKYYGVKLEIEEADNGTD